MKVEILTLAMAALLSAMLVSCEKDSERIVSNEEDDSRTAKQDCIDMLVESLYSEDIEEYAEVLLEPGTSGDYPEGYIWYNQTEDIRSGAVADTFLTFEEDTAMIKEVLLHEVGLEFMIYPSGWDSLEMFRNLPCTNCWETVRGYKIDISFDSGRHVMGDYYLRFLVGPDPSDSDKYLIYQIEDLRVPPGKVNMKGLISEDVSFGAIKGMFKKE
ncbi:MAG: hypothetical protein GF417_06660 [Candidatus Latescibacteria bacterium]|nr:hypothetical protein [bacterium]MBD3424099.1 hypothetical protein [Candidatus Latescibacterota bacterium]